MRLFQTYTKNTPMLRKRGGFQQFVTVPAHVKGGGGGELIFIITWKKIALIFINHPDPRYKYQAFA